MGEYLGVKHPGMAAILRRVSMAPSEFWTSPQGTAMEGKIMDLAAQDGITKEVEAALLVIKTTA